MIYIASDHAGFELKNKVAEFLNEIQKEYEDLGPHTFDPTDDYPNFAKLVVERVLHDTNNTGILICDTGIGMDITANKFKGIRAALCHDTFQAMRAKMHNSANILVLSSEYEGKSDIYKEIITTFLNTPFSNEERHIRRIKEIDNIC
jgi:ribose 5-phosphate isomerase B